MDKSPFLMAHVPTDDLLGGRGLNDDGHSNRVNAIWGNVDLQCV